MLYLEIAVVEPATVAELKRVSSDTTSISISWNEPVGTTFDRYKLTISPNDGSETLPILINKYVTLM